MMDHMDSLQTEEVLLTVTNPWQLILHTSLPVKSPNTQLRLPRKVSDIKSVKVGNNNSAKVDDIKSVKVGDIESLKVGDIISVKVAI